MAELGAQKAPVANFQDFVLYAQPTHDILHSSAFY